MQSIGLLPKTGYKDSSFRKRFILKLLSMPSSLVPMLAGLTDLIVLWGLNLKSGPAAFAGLASMLFGAGIFMTRLLIGNKKTIQSVLQSMQMDEIKRRERLLDDLDRRLSKDKDPRDEDLLRDLRSMIDLFQKGGDMTDPLGGKITFDILTGVDRMFRECVLHLDKTLELKENAETMATKALKKQLLIQREKMIRDIAQSITHLGKILSDITAHSSGLDDLRDSDLSRIRAELDRNLAVARKVNERMGALTEELEKEL